MDVRLTFSYGLKAEQQTEVINKVPQAGLWSVTLLKKHVTRPLNWLVKEIPAP